MAGSMCRVDSVQEKGWTKQPKYQIRTQKPAAVSQIKIPQSKPQFYPHKCTSQGIPRISSHKKQSDRSSQRLNLPQFTNRSKPNASRVTTDQSNSHSMPTIQFTSQRIKQLQHWHQFLTAIQVVPVTNHKESSITDQESDQQPNIRARQIITK